MKLLATATMVLVTTGVAAIPLEIKALPELSAYRTQIESIDAGSFQPLLELTGAEALEEPILIVLAKEDSPLAERTPPWISGWADGNAGLVVMFPSRARRYPDGGLEELLRHELSHVLAARVARGRPIPRWFNEGLAIFASRGWQLEDRSRMAFAMVSGEGRSVARLDALFAGGEGEMARAYAISGAFVRHLVLRHGREVTGDILRALSKGATFGEAFAAVTGESLAAAEESFWRTQTRWSRWVPFITSTLALWLFIALLAVWAIRRRRTMNRRRLEDWEADELGRAEEPAGTE